MSSCIQNGEWEQQTTDLKLHTSLQNNQLKVIFWVQKQPPRAKKQLFFSKMLICPGNSKFFFQMYLIFCFLLFQLPPFFHVCSSFSRFCFDFTSAFPPAPYLSQTSIFITFWGKKQGIYFVCLVWLRQVQVSIAVHAFSLIAVPRPLAVLASLSEHRL